MFVFGKSGGRDVILRRRRPDMSPNLRRLLQGLFAFGVIVALWFALVAVPPVGWLPALPVRGDHVLHALTFMTLTFLGAWLWTPLLGFAGLMVGAGGILELVQWPVGRDMSLGDWIASSAGVGAGLAVFVGIVALYSVVLRRRHMEKI